MSKIKVCMLTTSFPRYNGDPSSPFVYELAKNLVEQGVEVNVVAPHDYETKSYEIMDGIEIHRFQYMFPKKLQRLAYHGGIPSNLRKSLIAKLELPLFMLSFFLKSSSVCRKCDLMHAQWAPSGLITLFLTKIYKKPTLLMVHGAEVFTGTGKGIVGYVMSKCDHVVFNSSYTKRKSLEISSPKSSSIIPPGVDIERYINSADEDIVHNKLHVRTNTKILFSMGRLVERKGFNYLIEAMPYILKRLDVQLIIGGGGPEKKDLLQLINKLDLSQNVNLVGRIPDKELMSYYTQSDIFILPAIIDSNGDTEGLGVVLLESMACGKPVIGSNVGGIPDVITPDVGFLVEQKNPRELAEKIIYLLENDEIREEMGRNARKKVEEKFTWDKVTQEILSVYEHTLKVGEVNA